MVVQTFIEIFATILLRSPLTAVLHCWAAHCLQQNKKYVALLIDFFGDLNSIVSNSYCGML